MFNCLACDKKLEFSNTGIGTARLYERYDVYAICGECCNAGWDLDYLKLHNLKQEDGMGTAMININYWEEYKEVRFTIGPVWTKRKRS